MLIGADDWAAELTWAELAHMRRAVIVLQQQLVACQDWLMPEETLELEHEQADGGLWMQLSGTPTCWSLRFVLSPAESAAVARDRGIEGAWSTAASGALAAALQGLVFPMDMHVPA